MFQELNISSYCHLIVILLLLEKCYVSTSQFILISVGLA